MTTINGCVPEEIERFFSAGRGQTLLVKGPPGSGKTCFAFTLLVKVKGTGGVLINQSGVGETEVNRLQWQHGNQTAEAHRCSRFLERSYQRTEKLESPVVIIDSARKRRHFGLARATSELPS